MATIQSTKLLSRGKISINRTSDGLVVTSRGKGKNFGIYYIFKVRERTSYVATITGKKIDPNSSTILAVWSSNRSPLSCKRVFTTTSNTFAHMIPHRKGKQLFVGVLFQKADVGSSFLLSELSLMSRTRRKSVRFNQINLKSKPKTLPKPIPKPKSKTDFNQNRSTTLGRSINLDKIRMIASTPRVQNPETEDKSHEHLEHLKNLTQQLEKISKLKSDMEENFSKMFDEQRSRIRKLESERKSVRIRGDRESDSDDIYGSISESIELSDSQNLIDSLTYSTTSDT